MKYVINISTQSDHPTLAIMQDSWQSHYGDYKAQRSPISNTIKGALTSLDIKIGPEKFESPPWTPNDCKVDLSLADYIDKKSDSPSLQRALALEFIETKSHLYPVYTDGSKANDGRTSSAIVAPRSNYRRGVRIADDSSVYTAELIAIKIALEYLVEIKQENSVIFSDSLSVLQTFKHGSPGSNPPLTDEIRYLVRLLNNANADNVSFAWVPSHVGVSGNEAADCEAKLASQNHSIELHNSATISDAHCKIERYITGEWQTAWSSNPTGNYYRAIQPNVSGLIKYSNTTRMKEVMITRLRLGHCCLNHYLYVIDRHDTGLCQSCDVAETVEHHLLYCTANQVLSSKLKNVCSTVNKCFTIATILNESACIDIIYDSLSSPDGRNL
jgi:ribonuclease HI